MKHFFQKMVPHVKVGLYGGFPERFINAARSRGIDLFDFSMEGAVCSFCVRARDYKKLRKAARHAGCRMRLQKKFISQKKCFNIRFCREIMAGAAIFGLLLYICGNYVFRIEIIGNTLIPREHLLEFLDENGISFFSNRKEIEPTNVANHILTEYNCFSWAAVNLSYGTVRVELREVTPPPQSEETVLLLVASEAGIIKEIEVTSGKVLVTEGDVVLQNTPLVVVDESVLPTSWAYGVQARIKAMVERSQVFEIPAYEIVRERTGRSYTAYGVSCELFKIAPDISSESYEYYDVTTSEKPIHIFGVELPVHLICTTVHECSQTSRYLTEEQAGRIFQRLKSEYEEELKKSCEILSSSCTFGKDRGYYIGAVEYVVLTEIGKEFYFL